MDNMVGTMNAEQQIHISPSYSIVTLPLRDSTLLILSAAFLATPSAVGLRLHPARKIMLIKIAVKTAVILILFNFFPPDPKRAYIDSTLYNILSRYASSIPYYQYNIEGSEKNRRQ